MHRSRILQDPLVFQSKIKKLERDSVSEASCKTEEENKKIQLVKIFDRSYSAMRTKLRIVPLLLSFVIIIKEEVTSSLSTTLKNFIYGLRNSFPEQLLARFTY